MFDSLSDKLQEIIRKTSGTDKLTEDNMSDALREIRRALLEADVNLRVVKAFVASIRERAEGEKVVQGVDPAQQLIKIVNDELVKLLGGHNEPLKLDGHPSVIMMLGLQGSGKTTSSAKLAVKLKKEGKNPLLVACDVYRPAAIAQLKTLGEQTHDTQMMAELLILDRTIHPQEKLLVIDAMTGQEAVNVAENFNEQLEITGLVLTKLDGDSRGGAALSVVYCTQKPIKLTGVGEKLDALQDFYPDRMATRILGMGDIVSLVEKAQENFDAKQAQELEKKMRKAEFSYNDFLGMQKQMKNLGSIDQILGMLPIPGLKKDDRQTIAHEGEKQLKRIEAFIQSMTPEERDNPSLINTSRKKRIAKGCGMELHEINQFINQFDQMRQMMKGFSKISDKVKSGKLKMPKLPKGFGGKGRLPF